ncbi:MAG: 1-acyl-sn-glycerol-3-phosphate acyltransferase [Polaribacter sp.]|jgi:1-acyl-sn-glycerol-3-phosphate acyltransferase
MKVLSYILSPIFIFTFVLILLIFHPLQWIGLTFFGHKGHQYVVDILNFFLVKSLLLIGVTVHLKNDHELPKDGTLVFVSNHQSISDIPPIGWFFRKHKPKFVAKIELGKGIPSVSYNLKNGGAALIDRKDPKQAITALSKFSKNIHKNKWGAVIFPEGTRSKTGKSKPFSSNGLKIITKYNSEGYIVPVTINNSWKIYKYGKYPLGIGSPITLTAHKPIKIDSLPFEELMKETESNIISHIK